MRRALKATGDPTDARQSLRAACQSRLHGAREAFSVLAHRPQKLPVGEGHLQILLTVHGLSVLVLHLGDDLFGLHIDNVTRRKEGILPVEAHRDPVGGDRRGEGPLQHRPLAAVVVDHHAIVDVVHHPNLAFIRRQGDTMARAVVSEEALRPVTPLRLPHLGRCFNTLDHLAGLHVGDLETEQVVQVGVDPRRVVVDHEGAHVVRERNRLEGLHGRHVAHRHDGQGRGHERRLAVGTERHVVGSPFCFGGLDLALQGPALGVDHIPEVPQVRAHHQRPAVWREFRALATPPVIDTLPDLLVGAQIEGREAAPGRQIEHVGGRARGDPRDFLRIRAGRHVPGGDPLQELEVVVHVQDDDAYPVQFGRELPASRTARQSYVDKTPVALVEPEAIPEVPVTLLIIKPDPVRCHLLGGHIGRDRREHQSTRGRDRDELVTERHWNLQYLSGISHLSFAGVGSATLTTNTLADFQLPWVQSQPFHPTFPKWIGPGTDPFGNVPNFNVTPPPRLARGESSGIFSALARLGRFCSPGNGPFGLLFSVGRWVRADAPNSQLHAVKTLASAYKTVSLSVSLENSEK